MNDRNEQLTIGALARRAGVTVETIRFYQRRGLLAEPDRPYGGIRRYGAPEVARVRFIKAAQRLGFSLDDIAGLLRLADGTHCAEARVLGESKLREVRARLADLARLEAALTSLVDACILGGERDCPLIDALQGPTSTAECEVSPT
jgi:MerR family mercuric resistance operon transcriptional regulator